MLAHAADWEMDQSEERMSMEAEQPVLLLAGLPALLQGQPDLQVLTLLPQFELVESRRLLQVQEHCQLATTPLEMDCRTLRVEC